MVKRIIDLIQKEIQGLHEAAYLLAIFALLSQFLGLIRDRLLAAEFGASQILDVYYASFRLPDLLFVIVTALVSAAVLVPIFSQNLSDESVLKKHIDSLFTVFLMAMVAIVLVTIIFTPFILKLIAPGLLNAETGGQLILFTRILLLSPLLLGISQLFGGIIQAYRKFVLYAVSPILYNLGIIIGIIFLYPIFGNLGLIYGVVLGLIFHVLVQLPTIAKYNLLPHVSWKLKRVDFSIVKKVISLSLPRTIALASSQITLIVLIAIASTMAAGSIAIFTFAYNLQSVPMSIIGVSYSLAAFPTLSRLFKEGDLEKFLSNLVIAARHIIFWSIPVIVMFIVLRAQIVRTILGSGEFSWSDTRLTAAALALFIISALAQSLILLFVRGYYSAGQTKKPLIINVASSVVTVALAFWFVFTYQSNPALSGFFENILRVEGGLDSMILMLPLAFSVGQIFNVILLWIYFEKSFPGFSKTLMRPFSQSLFASFIAGYVSYAMLQIFDNILDVETLLGIFSQGFFAGMIGLIVGAMILFAMKNREISEVARTLHHRIWGARAITTGQEEL